jgi:hypothetical protein
VAHQAIRVSAYLSRVPFLKVAVRLGAFAHIEGSEIDKDDDVTAVRIRVLASLGADNDELQRGRIRDGREYPGAKLYAKVVLFPNSFFPVKKKNIP